MRLLRAGEALLGIAAALVPLDIWSAGGAEGLGWSTTQLWLAGSLIRSGDADNADSAVAFSCTLPSAEVE